MAKAVVTDQDADEVAAAHNPTSFDFTILLFPTWFEPITAIRAATPFFQRPIVVWGFSNFQHEGQRVNLGSTAGAGVTKGTLRELGVQHEYIYHSPGIGKDEYIKEKLQSIANVSRAITLMRSSRILSIGYQFGGMTLGDMDLTKMKSVFGPDLIEMDTYSLIRRMESMSTDSEAFRRAADEVMTLTSGTIGDKLERITKMYLALDEMVKENRAQALTIKCHFALSQEYGLTPCIPLSVIGNKMVASCEADIPLTLTQLALHYLSGGGTTTYADTHELTGDTVLWGACGFSPADMCVDGKLICQLPSGDAHGLGATFQDYITNKNWLKAGELTVARILKESNGGYTLHAAYGEAVGEIGNVAEFGAPQYSFTDMKLHSDFDRFAQNLGSHHYALVYGHLERELELFSRFIGVNLLLEK